MIFPSLLAIIAPVLTGLIFGVPGVIGLLVGGLGAGFVLAIFMANAGGAWDNAKKYTEEGNLGGKGGDVHKATVVGDTVGDPFKDTSPSSWQDSPLYGVYFKCILREKRGCLHKCK